MTNVELSLLTRSLAMDNWRYDSMKQVSEIHVFAIMGLSNFNRLLSKLGCILLFKPQTLYSYHHDYVVPRKVQLVVVITILSSFRTYQRICNRLTWRVPLLEQELLDIPEFVRVVGTWRRGVRDVMLSCLRV